MKNKNFLLDIIMTVILLLLYNLHITGISWHEILGVGIFGLFLIHNGFNFKWIKSITKNLFNPKLNLKTKEMYVLNWLLFISIILVTGSGILISRSLFPGIDIANVSFWSSFHHFFAYTSLAIVGVHIVLHTKMLVKKLTGLNSQKLVKATALVSVISVISLFYTNYVKGVKLESESYLEIPKTADSANAKTISTTPDPVVTPDPTVTTPTTTESVTTTAPTVKSATVPATTKSPTVTTPPPTLDKYLGSNHCGGCSIHCALNNTRCGKGDAYIEAATQTYNNTYPAVTNN